jgi:hypothetical protein
MEERIGALPAVLRSCLLQVGGVFLGGSHPSWTFTTDAEMNDEKDKPLFLADPLALPTASLLVEQMEDEEGQRPDAPWELWFSGDYVQKALLSGGGDALQMPCSGPDPILISGQRGELWLVDYLRTSLRFGGFPGFEFAEQIPDLIKELAIGLPQV